MTSVFLGIRIKFEFCNIDSNVYSCGLRGKMLFVGVLFFGGMLSPWRGVNGYFTNI